MSDSAQGLLAVGLIVVVFVALITWALVRMNRSAARRGHRIAEEHAAFLEAIKKSDLVKIRSILAQNSQFTYGPEGLRPLEVALEAGQPDALKLLMEEGSFLCVEGLLLQLHHAHHLLVLRCNHS